MIFNKGKTTPLRVIVLNDVVFEGTRYKRRGVDEDGNVANYVETEQVEYILLVLLLEVWLRLFHLVTIFCLSLFLCYLAFACSSFVSYCFTMRSFCLITLLTGLVNFWTIDAVFLMCIIFYWYILSLLGSRASFVEALCIVSVALRLIFPPNFWLYSFDIILSAAFKLLIDALLQ